MNPPREEGGVLISPPFKEWANLADGNLKELNNISLEIYGIPLLKIRENFRERLRIYGIPSGSPLILTGHQPHFIHPGIWFRYFLIERLNNEGINSSCFILDSDINHGVSAKVPYHIQGELFLKDVSLSSERKVFEFLPSPSKKEWVGFIKEILQSLNFPEGVQAKKNFSRIFEFQLQEEPYSRFWSRLRRFFENGPKYPEFPLSEVLKDEFHLFVLFIAKNAGQFLEVFNHATDRWRKEKKTRNQSIPFPDLKALPGKIELPFWYIWKGGRFPLFLNSRGNLEAGGKESRDLEDPSFLRNIRPRASTLTLFLRLVGCDLFLHGIGGGVYEQAVDFIIRDFFHIKPPHFVQATLTMYFPGFAHQEGQKIESFLREMRKSPEKFLSPEVKKENEGIILRKIQLRGTKLDRDGYRELETINKTLISLIEPQIRSFEEKAKAFSQKEEILSSREFPFFFFNPQDLRLKASQN